MRDDAPSRSLGDALPRFARRSLLTNVNVHTIETLRGAQRAVRGVHCAASIEIARQRVVGPHPALGDVLPEHRYRDRNIALCGGGIPMRTWKGRSVVLGCAAVSAAIASCALDDDASISRSDGEVAIA